MARVDPTTLITPALVDALGRVGASSPDALVEARLQAHWATQVLAAVGFSYLTPADDFSHTALQWDADARLLTGGALPDSELRAGLDVRGLTLHLGEERLALAGRMLADGYAWMRSAIERQTGQVPRQDLETPSHVLPDHRVEHDATFGGADEAALADLEAWFAAGAAVTERLAEHAEGAGEAMLWPHHFDFASLITVAGSDEDARTVGVGLSPGDEGKPQPYWYVTPWPAPKADDLPALDEGRWHTEGWTGAVLDAADLVRFDDGAARGSALATFMSSAVAAGRRLVGQQHGDVRPSITGKGARRFRGDP